MKRILLLISVLLFCGFALQEMPMQALNGFIFCKICHRILIVSDKKGCRKATPEVSDYMVGAACSPNWQVPVVLSCPFDHGPLGLKEEKK